MYDLKTLFIQSKSVHPYKSRRNWGGVRGQVSPSPLFIGNIEKRTETDIILLIPPPPPSFLDLPPYLPIVEVYKNQSYIVVPILAVQRPRYDFCSSGANR